MEEEQLRQSVQKLITSKMSPEACLKQLGSIVIAQHTGTCSLEISILGTSPCDVRDL